MTPIACVLFDLDGTLVDTAPDMAAALNRLRASRDLAPLPLEVIRPHVSHGSPALLKLGFDIAAEHADYGALRDAFLADYADSICVHTELFPGMAAVLDRLEANGITCGVVTNKPGWLTDPLLERLALTDRLCCAVSGDTLTERKPHPAPLLHACTQSGVEPAAAVYLGDALRDIQAARAAGIPGLAAAWGYVAPDEILTDWPAAAVLDVPADLLQWLGLPAAA